MKNVVIFGAAALGAAVAIGLISWKRAEVTSVLGDVMDEKVHHLQEKFMSLDKSNPRTSLDRVEQWRERRVDSQGLLPNR